MQRKTSPVATGVFVAAFLAMFLAIYAAAYWWRLPQVASGLPYRFEFPTTAETIVFTPAMMLHIWIHPHSMMQRINGNSNGMQMHDPYIIITP
jgi:hypothetical protein